MQKDIGFRSGVLGVVGALCREIGLVDVINEATDWHAQAKMGPGERILGLIMCIFGDRRALWRVHEYYEDEDLEVLFGPGVQSEDFNDDALARALDKLHEAGAQGVMATLAMRTLAVEEIPLAGALRADTATVSVWGEYQEPEDGAIEITFGHAKENNRMHSKQLQLGGVSVGPGMPVLGQVLSGNSSDKAWNFEMLETMSRQLDAEDLARLIYIGDSQLVTGPNLERIAKLRWRFISRLPSTYTLAGEVKAAAFSQGQWTDVRQISPGKRAASYKVQERAGTIDDRPYRLVVVQSSSLEKRKAQALERDIDKEREAIEAQATAWRKTPFSCQEDAEAALAAFTAKVPRFWGIQTDVQAQDVVLKRPHRGRPRKGEEPLRVTRYTISLRPEGPLEDVVQREKERLSTFVLITNVPPQDRTAEQVLRDYHSQFLAEQNWRFIKVPWHLSPVFLKLPRRVEAFAYVLLFALIVYRLIQHRARASLEASQQKKMLLPGGIWRSTPTTEQLLAMLARVEVRLSVDQHGLHHREFSRLRPEIRRVFDLLRIDPHVLTQPFT